MIQIHFRGQTCLPAINHYPNGNIALYLIKAVDKQPAVTCTVDVPGYELLENECLIKACAENLGVLEALVKAQVVTSLGIVLPYTRTGAIAHLCQLTPATLKCVEKPVQSISNHRSMKLTLVGS
jgi:hypothetical protein